MNVTCNAEKGSIVLIDGEPYLVEEISINVHMVAQRIDPLRDRVMALEREDEGLIHSPVFYQFSASAQSAVVQEIEVLVPAS